MNCCPARRRRFGRRQGLLELRGELVRRISVRTWIDRMQVGIYPDFKAADRHCATFPYGSLGLTCRHGHEVRSSRSIWASIRSARDRQRRHQPVYPRATLRQPGGRDQVFLFVEK